MWRNFRSILAKLCEPLKSIAASKFRHEQQNFLRLSMFLLMKFGRYAMTWPLISNHSIARFFNEEKKN